MKKLYSEKNYRIYERFLEKIANADDIIEGFFIYEKFRQWLSENEISDIAEQQMEKRAEMEFMKKNDDDYKCKIIEFPRKESAYNE